MNRRSAILAGLATLASGRSHGASSGNPVVLGNVALSFYAVTGAVVSAVLRRLGHQVEIIEGLHEQIFPLLGEGKIDLMAAAWLPEGHAAYWKQYGADAIEVAKLYEGAHFFWAVPDYVPESAVASIADLAKPGIAQRMARQIQGIGVGATISALSQKAIADYALGSQGYSFRPGTSAEWISNYLSAIEHRRWMIFPTWTPQYLNIDGRLRPLRDPLGTLGALNRASLVGPRDRVSSLPFATRRTLSRMEIGIDAVARMDRLVNAEQMLPAAAALRWMAESEEQVNSWF